MFIVIDGRIPSKKNNKEKTRWGLRVSDRYREWHKKAKFELMKQNPKKYTNIESISIRFIFPDNRKADLTNKAESIMDLLVDCGVIEDDSWQHVPKIILISMGKDKNISGVRIEIKEEE